MAEEIEVAYIGVDPVTHRANDTDLPLNTASEMRALEAKGVIEAEVPEEDGVEAEEVDDGDVEGTDEDDDSDEDELPPADSANDGSNEVEAPAEENPADKDGDGLIDQVQI